MTDNTYSAAPWHYRESDFDPHVWEIMADGCESPIAEVPRWKDENGNDSDEAKANLALIATAPQLLTALAYALEFLQANDDGEDDVRLRIAAIDAAMAPMRRIARAINDKANRPLIDATASLAACRLVIERWQHGDLAEAARTCQAAIDAYEAS